jgi:aspartate carbamoyltransferase catalytic subunit
MSKILKKNPAQSKSSPVNLSSPHLLSIEGMCKLEIENLLNRADYFANLDRHSDTKNLSGYVILNVFFENSTRTRVSFELAARRLGAEVINISLTNSAIKKGESLLDTASTLNAMKPDVLIVRHPHSGAPSLFAEYLDCSIVNAGDGRHEHPTQALLDALTIRRRIGYLEGLKVSICGDIANSRVARSNIHLLTIMGAEVRCIAPPTLMPAHLEKFGVKCYYDMREGIKNADVVMLLRLQTERMSGTENPSQREYFKFFGLDEEKLSLANPNAVIMHPGPMNRGVEIASALADDADRSLIKTQVEMGVAIRMATIEALNHTSYSNLEKQK